MPVRFGLQIPSFTFPTRARDNVYDVARDLARGAEALGMDSVWLMDHLFQIPVVAPETDPILDCWIGLAALAADTQRIRLGTLVAAAGFRPPSVLAKMTATLDVISHGRLIVGIGAGWLKEEFEALGTPPFEERGAVTDEYMLAFRELWTKDSPRFDGRFVKFKDVIFAPKPVQNPLQFWIGGESGPALRRSARLGDAWYPIGTNPQFPMNTLSRYRAGIERLRKLTQDAGRKPESVALTYRVQRFGPQVPAKADNGERMIFSGGNAEIIEDVRTLRGLGVSALDFNFAAPDVDAAVAAMRQFHEQVLAKA